MKNYPQARPDEIHTVFYLQAKKRYKTTQISIAITS